MKAASLGEQQQSGTMNASHCKASKARHRGGSGGKSAMVETNEQVAFVKIVFNLKYRPSLGPVLYFNNKLTM